MDPERDPEAGPPQAEDPPERTSGLMIETCYRHPKVATGVHCTRCGRPICPDCMTPAPVGYQCPECVREAQSSVPGRRVRLKFVVGRPGFMVTALMAVNVFMFLIEVAVGGTGGLFEGPSAQKLFELGALFPPAIAHTTVLPEHGQYWRLISAMFLHAGILHIAMNMYALYLFGYLIEGAFGWVRFLAIYFIAGFLASVASFTFGPVIEVGVGASGAIFGLLGSWIAHNYRRRGTAMAEANLRWALMLILLNVVIAFSFRAIDWRAHLGGVIAGFLAGWLAEGFGPPQTRRAVQVGGLALLVVIGILITAWRVATFPSLSVG
jgi:membrane associated rhomboid family serine protease